MVIFVRSSGGSQGQIVLPKRFGPKREVGATSPRRLRYLTCIHLILESKQTCLGFAVVLREAANGTPDFHQAMCAMSRVQFWQIKTVICSGTPELVASVYFRQRVAVRGAIVKHQCSIGVSDCRNTGEGDVLKEVSDHLKPHGYCLQESQGFEHWEKTARHQQWAGRLVDHRNAPA
jgi:hypothetical protein